MTDHAADHISSVRPLDLSTFHDSWLEFSVGGDTSSAEFTLEATYLRTLLAFVFDHTHTPPHSRETPQRTMERFRDHVAVTDFGESPNGSTVRKQFLARTDEIIANLDVGAPPFSTSP